MHLHTDHRRLSSRYFVGFLLIILIDHLPMLARHFLRPFNWRMLQTSLDHLTLQLIGVLLNGWVHQKFMIPRSIGFDLLSNVFVVTSKPFVRHMFDAHSQLLLSSYRGGFSSPVSPHTASVLIGFIRKAIFSVR